MPSIASHTTMLLPKASCPTTVSCRHEATKRPPERPGIFRKIAGYSGLGQASIVQNSQNKILEVQVGGILAFGVYNTFWEVNNSEKRSTDI